MRLFKNISIAAVTLALPMMISCGKNSDETDEKSPAALEVMSEDSSENMNKFLKTVVKEMEDGNKLSKFRGAKPSEEGSKYKDAITAEFSDGKAYTLVYNDTHAEKNTLIYGDILKHEVDKSEPIDAKCLKDFLKQKLPLDTKSFVTGPSPFGAVKFFSGKDLVLNWNAVENKCEELKKD